MKKGILVWVFMMVPVYSMVNGLTPAVVSKDPIKKPAFNINFPAAQALFLQWIDTNVTNIVARTAVVFLIDHGIDVNIQDSNGNTALIKVASLGQGVSFDAITGKLIGVQEFPLGDTEMVLRLLQAGADVNHQNLQGATALMKAVQAHRADVVTLLLDNGARSSTEK